MSPDPTWPRPVAQLENFLKSVGLHLEHQQESASFEDKLLLYTGESLAVRVVSDKGVWFIEVTNVKATDIQWFDAAIIRELLFGPGEEDVLSLEQQINFIEVNWPAIIRCFGPSEWQHTVARLCFLRIERTVRRLPGLFSPPSQIS
jgi:hypothetical protein